MPDTLLIRPATPADIGALLSLYRELQPNDPELEAHVAVDLLEQFAAYAGSAVLIGALNGVAVATCALVVVPNLTRGGRPYGLIENVVTSSSHRRRGHGEAVLRHAVDLAWQVGCYKVMLLTGSTRPETLRFYANAGFEQSKTGFQIRRAVP